MPVGVSSALQHPEQTLGVQLVQVLFCYKNTSLHCISVQESFWRFSIPEHKLEVLFLLVGKVSEPRVAFDRPGLNFGKVLVGGRTTETVRLVNSEHLPFEFQLDRATFDATDAVIESTGEPS